MTAHFRHKPFCDQTFSFQRFFTTDKWRIRRTFWFDGFITCLSKCATAQKLQHLILMRHRAEDLVLHQMVFAVAGAAALAGHVTRRGSDSRGGGRRRGRSSCRLLLEKDEKWGQKWKIPSEFPSNWNFYLKKNLKNKAEWFVAKEKAGKESVEKWRNFPHFFCLQTRTVFRLDIAMVQLSKICRITKRTHLSRKETSKDFFFSNINFQQKNSDEIGKDALPRFDWLLDCLEWQCHTINQSTHRCTIQSINRSNKQVIE